MRRLSTGRLVASLLTWVPVTAAAQFLPPTAWGRALDGNRAAADVLPAWLGAWSPLRPIVEAVRTEFSAPLSPGVLEAPAPAVGAFILAGAPGSLARDLGQPADYARFGTYSIRSASESGTFHRPLDIAESRVVQVSGMGWQRVGTRGVAIGKFTLDREHNDASSYTARVNPYASSPIIMTDSVRPPMRRARARLEGALGLKIGGFGVGVAAGIETREHGSVDFPLRRTGRATSPAGTAGVERVLPWFGARIGAYRRWTDQNESNVLNARPLPTMIYPVRGYDEPFGREVTSLDPAVFTRNERRAAATGGSLAFAVLGAHAVITYEAGNRADDQTLSPFNADRPIDRWRAEGRESRVQLQRPFGSRVLATIVASAASLEGSGERSDLVGIAFAGDDSRTGAEADVRINAGAGWLAAVAGGVVQTHHARTDFVAQISSDLNSRTPFISGELAKRFHYLQIAAGASAAVKVPLASRIPGIDARGANYVRIIAPELAYEVAETRATAAWLLLNAPVRNSILSLSVRMERVAPTRSADAVLQPTGDRSYWSVALGIRP